VVKLALPAFCFVLISVIALSWQALANEDVMKIKISIEGGDVLTATMEDNSAARDFVSLLPITLEMNDFAGTEKAAGSLPKNLSTEDAPQGHKPEAGDLAHYAPWNNLAAFYKADKYAGGLVLLGRIDGDPSALDIAYSITVTIEQLN